MHEHSFILGLSQSVGSIIFSLIGSILFYFVASSFALAMAHALGSLDPAICESLEESKPLLIDKADPEILSQVLIEMDLLAPKAWKNMVYDF